MADRTNGRAYGTICHLSVIYYICTVAKRYVVVGR